MLITCTFTQSFVTLCTKILLCPLDSPPTPSPYPSNPLLEDSEQHQPRPSTGVQLQHHVVSVSERTPPQLARTHPCTGSFSGSSSNSNRQWQQ